jgi:hypothetical protein
VSDVWRLSAVWADHCRRAAAARRDGFPRPCVCGHLHFATCPHCGCADYLEET